MDLVILLRLAVAMTLATKQLDVQSRGVVKPRSLAGALHTCFVEKLRTLNLRLHVAQDTSGPSSASDRRATQLRRQAAHPQAQRGRTAEAPPFRFGWMITAAGMKKTELCGLGKVDWDFAITAAATTWCGCLGCWRHDRATECPLIG